MLLKFTIVTTRNITTEEQWILPVVGWSKNDGYRLPGDSFNNVLLDDDGDAISDVTHAFIQDGSTLTISWDDSRASHFFEIKEVEVVDGYPDMGGKSSTAD